MIKKAIQVDPGVYDFATQKENAAAIAEFLAYLRMKRWSEKTVASYEVALRQLFNYCGASNLRFADLKPNHATAYIASVFSDYKPNTKRMKLAALRSFFDYLQAVDKAPRQPFLQLFLPKPEKSRYTYITDADFGALLKYIDSHSNFSVQFAVRLMRYCGLRVSEGIGLNLFEDIKPASSGGFEVTVKGKGAKFRTVPVLNKSFNEEIATVQAMYRDPSFDVVLDYSTQTINFHLERFSKEIGSSIIYSSHDLRRAFASDMMEKTGNIEVVRYLLGHESFNTTLIYLRDSRALVQNALQGVTI